MTTKQKRIAELEQLIEDNMNSPLDDYISRLRWKQELDELQS